MFTEQQSCPAEQQLFSQQTAPEPQVVPAEHGGA
jgi:hypothetical protein